MTQRIECFRTATTFAVVKRIWRVYRDLVHYYDVLSIPSYFIYPAMEDK